MIQGAVDLRDAITQANASSAHDVVAFDATFFNHARTISLLSALPQFPSAGGPLTINGPGAIKLTIRRSATATTDFRIFDSATNTLNISGLTASFGNPTDGQFNGEGGGLCATGMPPNITLDSVTFSNNTSPNSSGGADLDHGERLLDDPQQYHCE